MPSKIFIAGFLSCLMLLCGRGLGQSFNSSYFPERNFRPSAETMKAIKASYGEEKKKNTDENKKVRDMINESIEGLSDYITALDSFRLIMEADSTTRYLRKIAEHISQKNPELITQKFHVFTSRTTVPNAANFGAGVIVVNLGLINRYRSEPEIAFVLCHEMSHQLLNHVMNGIKKRAEIFYNKDFQKELKKAQRQEYNSLETTEKLRDKYVANYTTHTREQEYAADSLGLILFNNAGYSPLSAVSETNFLDSIDIPLYSAPINYRNYFEFSQSPFHNDWLAIDPTLGALGGNIDSLGIRPDSLKTHPDCPQRAKALERIAKKENMNNGNNFLFSSDYSYYQTASRFERVEYFLNEDEFGLALYDALQLSSQYPENLFLKCAIANALCEIYNAQIKHTFSEVVDFPDMSYSKSYNEFLSFLHNISASQLKNLTINYCNSNVITLKKEDSYCRYIDFLVKGIDKPKAEYTALVADYQKDNILDAHYKALLDGKYKTTSTKKK